MTQFESKVQIVRLQTRIRRKDGTENFGGFVFVLDLHNGILCCGFLCARLVSVSFSGYHAEGYHAPPIPYGYHAEGYYARTDTFKLTGYHVCRVTTPELPRSIQTSGCRRVITRAGSFELFFLPSAKTSVLHNNNHNFSTESGAHRTDPLNTLASSNNSEASVWMVGRPCVGRDLLYREWTWAAAGGRMGKTSRMRRATP